MTTLDPTTAFRPFAVITQSRRINGHDVQTHGIELRFHEGQKRTYASNARIVAMISGSQGGKTSMGPWWLYREGQRCGPGDYLAVTSTYDLFKLRMLPAIREVLEFTLGVARYWAGDQVLELCEHAYNQDSGMWEPIPGKFSANQATDPMWARWILRSASSSSGLESATAKGAWLDEAGMEEFGLDAWEAILRRLSIHRGRILITTTPYNNTGWLKREVFDRWRGGDEQVDVIQFASKTNPAFPEEEFEERKKNMVNWKFSMFYEGQFERPAGLIYPDYQDTDISQGGHVVAPFAIPKGWTWVLGVAPGPVHYALLHGAIEPKTQTLYITKEQMFSYRATSEIVRDVLNMQLWSPFENNQPFSQYYVGGTPDVQAREDWIAAGAHPVYEPPFHDVESGIDRGTFLIRSNRLRVFSTCMGFRDELNSYRREMDANGTVMEKIHEKERYHFSDAFRYIASGITFVRMAVWSPAPKYLKDFRGDAL